MTAGQLTELQRCKEVWLSEHDMPKRDYIVAQLEGGQREQDDECLLLNTLSRLCRAAPKGGQA